MSPRANERCVYDSPLIFQTTIITRYVADHTYKRGAQTEWQDSPDWKLEYVVFVDIVTRAVRVFAWGTPWESVAVGLGAMEGAACEWAAKRGEKDVIKLTTRIRSTHSPGKPLDLIAIDASTFIKSPALLGTVETRPTRGASWDGYGIFPK